MSILIIKISHLSPSFGSAEHSLNTLRYTSRVKDLPFNSPESNHKDADVTIDENNAKIEKNQIENIDEMKAPVYIDNQKDKQSNKDQTRLQNYSNFVLGSFEDMGMLIKCYTDKIKKIMETHDQDSKFDPNKIKLVQKEIQMLKNDYLRAGDVFSIPYDSDEFMF